MQIVFACQYHINALHARPNTIILRHYTYCLLQYNSKLNVLISSYDELGLNGWVCMMTLEYGCETAAVKRLSWCVRWNPLRLAAIPRESTKKLILPRV